MIFTKEDKVLTKDLRQKRLQSEEVCQSFRFSSVGEEDRSNHEQSCCIKKPNVSLILSVGASVKLF